MQELTDAIRSPINGKTVGLDGGSAQLFKTTLKGNPALRPMSSFVFGGGGGAAAVEICHHHGTPQK